VVPAQIDSVSQALANGISGFTLENL
jgi:hypothetical protein